MTKLTRRLFALVQWPLRDNKVRIVSDENEQRIKWPEHVFDLFRSKTIIKLFNGKR